MLNPGHQNSRLILELRPLRLKIFFGIFAGAIFEAKVAQVFVELILALQQVVHASLLPLAGKHVLWPEGVKQQRNCQQSAHYYALQCCHCLKPSVLSGICLTANFFTSRHVLPGPASSGRVHRLLVFFPPSSDVPEEQCPAWLRRILRMAQSRPRDQILAWWAQPAQPLRTWRQ